MPPSLSRPDTRKPADHQSTQPSANHRSPDLQHPDQQHLGRRLPARQLPHDVTETDLKRIVLALETAADVLHRLSRQDDERPAGSCSAWHEMLRASHVAASGTRRSGMARPSPAEITAMEEMIALLWSVTSRQRQLLWARACRVRWAALQTRYRRSRTTPNRDYRKALLAMLLAERNARTSTLRPRPASQGQIQKW